MLGGFLQTLLQLLQPNIMPLIVWLQCRNVNITIPTLAMSKIFLPSSLHLIIFLGIFNT